MRTETYDDAGEKSRARIGQGNEVPKALAIFNQSVTQLLKEVELSQDTDCDLGSLKVEVNRQVRCLVGAR
jgi:hypothetical protein